MKANSIFRRVTRAAHFAALAGAVCFACVAESAHNEADTDSPAANETTASGSRDSAGGATIPDSSRRGAARDRVPGRGIAGADSGAAAGRGTTGTDAGAAGRATTGGGANTARPEAGTAQDAVAILRRASDAYERVRSMKASFAMTVENPLLRNTTNSRGTLYQRSPDRIKLEFSDPAGDVIVGDGTYFWIYYPSADPNQVIRTTAAQAGATGSVDLRAQFVGDPVERFDFTLHGTEAVDGRPASVLTLVPRQDMGYQQLKVWIDAQDSHARKFEIVEHSGLMRRVHLTDLEMNPALADSVFRFTPPPGARIIER